MSHGEMSELESHGWVDLAGSARWRVCKLSEPGFLGFKGWGGLSGCVCEFVIRCEKSSGF